MKSIIKAETSIKLTCRNDEYRLTLPQVTDVSNQEGIRIKVELIEEELSELEITLYPLNIGRPEFFPDIKGRVAVIGKGIHFVELPFEQFEFRQMAGAFLSYLNGISVKLLQGGDTVIKSIEADTMGDFEVKAESSSLIGEPDQWVEYSIKITNKAPRRRIVNIHQSKYGKECLYARYKSFFVIEAGEEKEYYVRIRVTKDIPAGGLEKSIFIFVPDGDGTKAKRIILQTTVKRKHPYLFMKEQQWQRRRKAICSDEGLWEAFYKEYLKTAEDWQVPNISGREDYVYPAYSQNELFKTVVAWKITGKDELLKKALKYICGLIDEKNGYLATQKSYFEFIESRDEYARGDFKVCHAQSAGWVQEAEFFNRVAMSYDLLYDKLTIEQHKGMEKCLKNYMKFSSWRLTDGDGNNFQIAETAAGMLCAMVLQDKEMADRFIYGYNGFVDLLSAVLLDDGMYFEEASGYVRLAGELFFDIVNGAENYGISLKEVKVPASFDRNILHSPWAMRETWADDGKPFLGMSFRRFDKFTTTTRTVKDYFDTTARLLTDKGIMMSVNDSNEQDFTELYKKAYYLYREPLYGEIAALSAMPEPLLVPEEHISFKLGKNSLLLQGAGLGILRNGLAQAVLKFGGHGGYHGHYDRLSLASFIKEEQTFHNNEYAWYGYNSFLFKMWVQTSMAHNMTVVDGRMQKPSPCQCVCYIENGKVKAFQEKDSSLDNCMEEEFCAVCAQTTAMWIDPPYGGQTPYPLMFPDEKCAREGRFILKPCQKREQGDIGEYSEPVFQRRLLILFHGYCIVWDYLEGREVHRYDCLYHPMGRFEKNSLGQNKKIAFTEKPRFFEDPFGAGQFIMNCHEADIDGTVCLRFHDAQQRINGNDVMDNMPEAAVWRAWPKSGAVTVGRYPQKEDSFTEENQKAVTGYLNEPLKKTVSFTVKGEKAEFITILEAGKVTEKIKHISCEDFCSILVTEDTGAQWRFIVAGIDDRKAEVSVTAECVAL